jgi:hypothetical protein
MTLTRRRACLGAISTALGRRANMVFLSGGSAVQNSGGLMRPAVQPVAADLFIQAHGDSFTFDMGDFNNYLFVLKASILASKGLNARVARRGINGISYNYRWPSQPYNATLISDAATGVDVSRVPGIDNWLLVLAGTNGMSVGLGGNSAAVEYGNFKTYIAQEIAAGWVASRIVVGTCAPRSTITEVVRGAFNTSLVGDDGGYGYRVARLDLNTNIGAAGANNNLAYYQADATHWNPAGHVEAAGVFFNTMFP